MLCWDAGAGERRAPIIAKIADRLNLNVTSKYLIRTRILSITRFDDAILLRLNTRNIRATWTEYDERKFAHSSSVAAHCAFPMITFGRCGRRHCRCCDKQIREQNVGNDAMKNTSVASSDSEFELYLVGSKKGKPSSECSEFSRVALNVCNTRMYESSREYSAYTDSIARGKPSSLVFGKCRAYS